VLFHSGWFVESLATQTLVIFVIRTRRVPFFHSRPSFPLLATTLACVAVGVALPFSPLASLFGFKALPVGFFAILVLMVVTYLGLVEAGKSRFFRPVPGEQPLAKPRERRQRRIHRLAGVGATRSWPGPKRPQNSLLRLRGDWADRQLPRASKEANWLFDPLISSQRLTLPRVPLCWESSHYWRRR